MPSPKRHLLICTNRRDEGGKPSCAARGSETLLAEVKQGVKAAGLAGEVWVTRSGCLKHCSQGPAAVLWPEGLVLAGLGPADTPALVEHCARRGEAPPGKLAQDKPWE